jgi:hypothetical protein
MQLMYRRGSLFAGLALAASLAACFPNPATGVGANGETLRVQYLTGTGTFVSNDKTGEDVTTHSDGSQHVTEHFSEVAHTYQWNDWKYFQGRQELDEQDYYRIAGDVPSARSVENFRANASLKMNIGLPVAIVGLLLTSISLHTDSRPLATAGGLVGVAGAVTWYWGRHDMANRHHLPAEHADELAGVIEECNEGHCTRARGGRPVPPRASDLRPR